MSAFGPRAAAAYDLVRSHVSRKCDRLTEKGVRGALCRFRAAREAELRAAFTRV